MTKRKKFKKNKKSRIGTLGKVWIILLIVSMTLGVFGGITLLYMPVGTDSSLLWFLEDDGVSLDNPKGGVVNILALGTDEGGYRSDTIMLININGETGKLNILSIPRDTAIASRNSDGSIAYNSRGVPSFNKINSYLAIGKQQVAKGQAKLPEELMIRKVKEITGLPIHYYVTVDFDGFIDIIDALGGVDFNVPEDMNYDDPSQDLHIHLKKGQQHLDGQAAHDFVRYRSYKNGRADLARVDAQQNFIKEIVRQKLTAENIGKVDEIYGIISKNVTTNYKLKDLRSSLGTIEKLNADKVKMYVLPNTPSMINGTSYVLYNTEENMEELDKILDNFRSKEEKEKRKQETN